MEVIALLLLGIAVVTAAPDTVLVKYEAGSRYQHIAAPGGVRLQDLWLKVSDVAAAARFNAETDVGYHLFTRDNPNVSQPIVLGFPDILQATNYDASRKTVILVHGWLNTPTSDFNVYSVHAYLQAEDVNVIMVDWSIGAEGDYLPALLNAISAAEAVARFVTWLNEASGSSISQYHLVGHSLGGHQVGIIGRRHDGQVPYITSLDPAWPGWITNPQRFRSDDGIYTEAMHTDIGLSGYLTPVADVDFYPNGGRGMPNCVDSSCDHHQCIFYFAESLTSGGFTGTRCSSYLQAIAGSCSETETLQMGGPVVKTGSSGVYYLETNANPPYSRG